MGVYRSLPYFARKYTSMGVILLPSWKMAAILEIMVTMATKSYIKSNSCYVLFGML